MRKYDKGIMAIGGILVLAGAILQISQLAISPYLFIIGSVMFGYVQVFGDRYDGNNFIIRRLRRQQILGAMLLVFTGVLMLTAKRNEWIVCMSIATFIELYTAYRIPAEIEKEKRAKE